LLRLTLDQMCDFGARGFDPAFQSLPLSAERVEEFGQLYYRDGERDGISCRVAAKIQTL
jgi:hypothetical protein